jgi:hypothetical protein
MVSPLDLISNHYIILNYFAYKNNPYDCPKIYYGNVKRIIRLFDESPTQI